MTAFNIVRFRVKPGRENDFLAAHKAANRGFPGMRRFSMVKTGEGAYCVIGEWTSFDKIVAARPAMIAILDTFRDCLMDLGGSLGVTDPVAGIAVMEINGSAKAKPKSKHASKKRRRQLRSLQKSHRKNDSIAQSLGSPLCASSGRSAMSALHR
jgi:hypothetical protein